MNIESCINDLNSKFDIVGIVDCDAIGTRWHELYLKLHELYQEEYQNNQRIIVKTNIDFYNQNEYGITLQSLQAIVNEVDISNFFICLVSCNPDLEQEYHSMFKQHSIDDVPFSLHRCDGKFTRHTAHNVKPFIKMQSLKSNADEILDIQDKHKQLLFENKNFCIVPWTSIMVTTDNKVRPCCEYKGTIGDASKNSLEEIWNSEEYRNIRTSMLNNQAVPGCKDCVYKETFGRETLRTSLNREFVRHVTKTDKTHKDGSLDVFELIYLDSRFNNLCNLSCRSCKPSDSSSWHKPAVELGIIAKDSPVFLSAGRHKDDLLNQILEQTQNLQRIYFAGGEPLIIEEFYKILYELEAQGRTDVELVYNTNLTKKKLKNHCIFDAWKNFDNISIGASLDAEGTRGEYLRSGTVWKDVVAFRKEMINKRPDIDFYISATTGLINALHVPDFHRSWVEQGLIRPEDFNIQMLFGPEYMRVDTAPKILKNKIKEKYQQHLDWLSPLDPTGRATYGFESIVKQIDNDIEFDRNLFWDNVNLLDNYYKTNLLETFPELEDLK